MVSSKSLDIGGNGGGGGRGFSVATATVFIIGEVAGGGILSLAHATAQASWWALGMIAYCATCAALAGLCLAQSWLLLEERYPAKYKGVLSRKPYATIACHAFGPLMSALVSTLMNVTRIGATAVFLLLTSGFLLSLTQQALPLLPLTLCQWIPLVAATLLPLSFLGSPADFWPIAYAAMGSTTLGSVLLIAALISEMTSGSGLATDFHLEGFQSLSTAFGSILFAFGGASAFPNFQMDMKRKERFPLAVVFGFSGLLLLYLPAAGLGYAAYGYQVHANIIENMPPGPLVTLIELCFLVHCFTVVLIVVNPVFLDLEELCQVPKYFTWKRCLFRTAIFLLVVAIGETFPNFGQILDLIGGSTVTLLAFVLPPIFYAKLCRQDAASSWEEELQLGENWSKKQLPVYLLAVFALIVTSGIVGGVASTFSVLQNWAPLDSACYLGGGGGGGKLQVPSGGGGNQTTTV